MLIRCTEEHDQAYFEMYLKNMSNLIIVHSVMCVWMLRNFTLLNAI